MLEISFWILAILCAYSYIIYPIILWLITRLYSKTNTINPHQPAPSISLIITVHNEEQRISKKLENSLALKYRESELEIIVASDQSDDKTDSIVDSYADKNIRLVRATERLGKENAQLCAIKEARGEVLVFSDVATEIPVDALDKLAHYFKDPTIGAISSEDRFISKDGEVAGEGIYVKYEMWLRQQESKLAGLIGLSGSFFAARKEICKIWDIKSPSDFNTALNTYDAGYRSVSAPDVHGFYRDLSDPKKEFARKKRTIIRGITALSRNRKTLNPASHGFFAFQVFSHKLMRWLTPVYMMLFLAVNIPLSATSASYGLILFLQILFYSLAIGSHFHPPLRKHPVAKVIYFFVQANIAIFQALCDFISGKRMSVWQPSVR